MPTFWMDTLINLVVASDGQDDVGLGVLTADISVSQRRLERFTVLRTIIGIDIAPTIRDSGEGDQIATLGIGVISRETLANPPDPNSAADFPQRGWLWRARYRVYASAVDDMNISRVRVDLDLRGKRKVEAGSLELIMNNDANQGSATSITATGLIRVLFLVG